MEESSCTGENPDTIVLDGCAILLTINFPIYCTLLNWMNAVTDNAHMSGELGCTYISHIEEEEEEETLFDPKSANVQCITLS